ncbi:hypothetical protein [Rhodococcus sp. P1Y]|nr:hypothetical protein [Rhodococcus sp. P1Y]
MTSKNSENHTDNDAEPKGGHPGPVDEGKNGGMATRELAPELTEDEK